MNSIVYILKIILYFIFVYIMYQTALKEKNNKKKKIPFVIIFLFSIFMGFYSLICGKYPYVSDRLNFAFRFADDIYLEFVKDESLGLYLIEIFLHTFTHNPKILFFSIAFLYMGLTLKAYNNYEEVEPYALLILGLSAYLSYGFYMLKQCIAIAFIALSFSEYSKRNKKKCFLYVFLGIMFHESAWIMIPIYLSLKFLKNKFVRRTIYLLLFAFLIFFSRINGVIINIFIKVIPSLGKQLASYLASDGSISENLNFMTILKGIPFYFITFFAIKNKSMLQNKIEDYDKYLFISYVTSVLTFSSMFMYWMFRFATYCYFPTFVFASLIYKNLEGDKKDNFGYCLILMFGILTLRLWIQYYFRYGGI